MSKVGFLHTAEVHVATFDRLLAEAAPDARAVHAVAPALLDRARAGDPDGDLAAAVGTALRGLVEAGAEVVVCTCSTLGPLAEAAALPVPVLRVDRPMACAALAAGPRVAVVAALASTLQPTRALLQEEAAAARVDLLLDEVLVAEAWAAFEAGDTGAYLDAVTAAVRSAAADADVVVLAQASMGGALDRLAGLGTPVLASPRLAVEAALQAAGDRPAAPADRGVSRP